MGNNIQIERMFTIAFANTARQCRRTMNLNREMPTNAKPIFVHKVARAICGGQLLLECVNEIRSPIDEIRHVHATFSTYGISKSKFRRTVKGNVDERE